MFQLIEFDDALDYLSLEKLKNILALDGDEHDDRLEDVIKYVFDWWRKEGGNVPAVYDLLLPCFPSCKQIIALKKNLDEIEFFKYRDTAGELAELTAPDEETDGDFRIYRPEDSEAFLEPVSDWPAITTESRRDAVQIRFSTTVDDFDLGALRTLAALYDRNREGFELPGGIGRMFAHARGSTYG